MHEADEHNLQGHSIDRSVVVAVHVSKAAMMNAQQRRLQNAKKKLQKTHFTNAGLVVVVLMKIFNSYEEYDQELK
jgi:hypothetical protein